MPLLSPFELDKSKLKDELTRISVFLADNKNFIESSAVNELKACPNLSSLIGWIDNFMSGPDRMKPEFEIIGAFRADLVVGNFTQQRYVFVEFEGGEVKSAFDPKRGTKQFSGWGGQMEHGFSQLVDWAWAVEDVNASRLLSHEFGSDTFTYKSLLVCGRRDDLSATDRDRLRWRCKNVRIGACDVLVMTWDELLEHFEGAVVSALR